MCKFPFQFNDVNTYTCVINGNTLVPQCMTTLNEWSTCIGQYNIILLQKPQELKKIDLTYSP
jgi:hypothetical protein